MEHDDSDSDQFVLDFPPTIRIYKDGRIQRLVFLETVPPCTDPDAVVQSRDVTISPETGVAARLFLPKTNIQGQKFPLLIYIHGGAFCTGSPFAPEFHNHVSALAAQANAIAVSIHYRLAPEHPLPVAYEDSWSALQWVAAHSNGANGPEAWLNDHADFGRVFLAGESAGANLSHTMAMRIGLEGLPGLNLVGMVLVHPFFGNDQPDKLVDTLYPSCTGLDDPKINPAKDPNVAGLGCRKVLILIAEKDFLKDRGCAYFETLKKESGWGGEVEIVETEGEEHAFHLFDPHTEKAISLVKKIASFVSQNH